METTGSAQGRARERFVVAEAEREVADLLAIEVDPAVARATVEAVLRESAHDGSWRNPPAARSSGCWMLANARALREGGSQAGWCIGAPRFRARIAAAKSGVVKLDCGRPGIASAKSRQRS